MEKEKHKRFFYKLISLFLVFTLFGNVTLSSAMQIIKNEDINEKVNKQVSVKEKNEPQKQRHEEKVNTKSSSLDNIDIVLEGNENSDLQIDINNIIRKRFDNYNRNLELYGTVKNTGKKTYSFRIRANFYDMNGYKYHENSYDIINARPNEEESFILLGVYPYYDRETSKIEIYLENVVEIYDNNDENNIKIDLKKIEYTTNSSGNNRQTKITADVTNNSDYMIQQLGVKFSLRDKNSKVINVLHKQDIQYLGVGETREVTISTNGICEDEYEFYKTNVTTYINTNYKINKINFSEKSPQYINKQIEIDAIVEKSEYNDEYKYSIYDGEKWSTLRGWNSSSKFIWKPSIEGTYKIKVEVRKYNSSKIEATKIVEYKVVDPKLGNLSVSLDKKSPQVAGTTVNIKATSTGENPQFKFEIKKDSKTIAKKDYSGTNYYNWIPSEAGTYTINIYSRNKSYTDIYNKKTITYKVTKPSFSIKSLTVNKKSPQPTEDILKLTANATGSNLLYKFSYYNGKKWVTIKDYSTSKTVSWKPNVTGKLKLRVDIKVKDTNYSTSKSINYEVFKKGTVNIKSFTVNKKSPQPQNTTIKLNTTAVGSNLQYKYAVYNGKKWVTIRDYSSSSSCNWNPKTAYSKYKIKVYVKTKGYSKVYTKQINYNIFKPGGVSITNLKSSKNKKVMQYDMLTISANVKGNYLEYRFKSYNPYTKKWYIEKDFSSSKSIKYYVTTAGTNKIKVEVRQRGCSTIYSKTINIKVHSKPSITINGRYYHSWDGSSRYISNGYFNIVNYGSKTIKIKKLEIITDDTVVYRYSPKSFNINKNSQKTLNYYASYNEKSDLPYIYVDTYWKITYEYDGLTHTCNMYQQ